MPSSICECGLSAIWKQLASALISVFLISGVALWHERCVEEACTLAQPISTFLWPWLVTIFHYQTRSYEDFMLLQSGPGWINFYKKGEYGKGVKQGNQTQTAHNNFMVRNTSNSGVHDASSMRYLPRLTAVLSMSMQERLEKFHHTQSCVLGYRGDGLECRRSFLTLVAQVAAGQEVFLDEWISFHLAVGIDHFLLMNRHNSSSIDAVLAPYVEAGIVDLQRYPFPAGSAWANITNQDYFSWKKAAVLQNNASAFWWVYADIDEFIAPPRTKGNLPEYPQQLS